MRIITLARILILLFPFQQLEAQITGVVYRDFNFNGTKEATNPIEPGVAGITVTAYNTANTVVATTTTSATGTYSLTVGAIPVRIEFTGLAVGDNHSRNATAGTNPNGTNVQFATGPAAAVNFAISYADNYSANLNPKVVTPQLVKGSPSGPTNTNGLKIFDYNANVTDAAGPVPPNLATKAQVGANWGVAYDKYRKVVYSAAFLKRHVGLREGLATNPIAAIYKIQSDGTSFGLWTEISGLTAVGTNAARGLTLDANNSFNDPTTYGLIAKRGIGGIDVDEQAKFLYAVNLENKRLVKIPINTNGTAGTQSAYNIPTSGITVRTVSTADMRPFAVKCYRGKIYVGVTFSAETAPNNTANNLVAAVYEFDPVANTFSATPFYQMGLNYNRSTVITYPSGLSAAFRPWSDSWSTASSDGGFGRVNKYNPQPVFSDIEFDIDGSMIFGIFDRFGHQTGASNYDNPADNATLYGIYAGGDLIRICKSGSTFSACNLTYPPTAGVTEYYNTGVYVDITVLNGHSETAVGGLALLSGTDEVMSTVYDPIDAVQAGVDHFYEAGTVKYTNSAPGKPALAKRNLITLWEVGNFEKANGLGDLELLTALEPIQIGNRIWEDTDEDGIQDANETAAGAPIGTTVTLRSPGVDGIYGNADDQTWTTTTDANGNYYFSTLSTADNRKPASWLGVGNTVLPGYDYRIEVIIPATKSLVVADVSSNTKDNIDNDATNVSGIAIININTANTNHNYDIGFTRGNNIGDYVWLDANTNGIQDAGESGVAGIKVVLYNSSLNAVDSATTNSSGIWGISKVPAGTGYFVKYYGKSGTLYWTIAHVGDIGGTIKTTGPNDAATDSDSNPSGETLQFDLTGTTNDLKIDAGLSSSGALLEQKIISFTTIAQHNTSLINLKLSQNYSATQVILQHSSNGLSFADVGLMRSEATNTNFALEHLYPLLQQKNYYRAKIKTADNQITYSNITIVVFEQKGGIIIYPNPAKGTVSLKFPASLINENVIVSITNNIGQTVYYKNINKISNVEKINLEQFSSGIYRLLYYLPHKNKKVVNTISVL